MKNLPAISSLRILLVENHRDSRELLTLYLEGSGHRVTTAATMQEALAVALRQSFDVLLSDISLPDGDGWELLEQARFSNPVAAIAMSGFGMNADRVRSIRAGYQHHLLKPLKLEQLNSALAEAAERLPDSSP